MVVTSISVAPRQKGSSSASRDELFARANHMHTHAGTRSGDLGVRDSVGVRALVEVDAEVA